MLFIVIMRSPSWSRSRKSFVSARRQPSSDCGQHCAIVILTALPLMVIMPPSVHALGLPPVVAGAWFGGNIDTTASVVGAGTLYGAEAQATATVFNTLLALGAAVVIFGR
jgi:uncharacterized membrane protein YadS